jgi:hypothetical protein
MAPSIHISNMHFANMMLPYDPSQNFTNDLVSRYFQPTSTDMEMNLTLFSTHGLTTSVPYQSGAFVSNHVSVDTFNMEQAPYYPPNMRHSNAAYPNVQLRPTVRDAQNVFKPMIKSESTSATQPNLIYNNTPCAGCERFTHEPTIKFNTRVDILMSAIQARQTGPPQPLEPKVRDPEPHLHSHILTLKQEEVKVARKPRKRYQCFVPNCDRSFYQNTHLQTHIRAHTGEKPFVGFS